MSQDPVDLTPDERVHQHPQLRFWCPTCSAPPGERCTTLWSATSKTRAAHPARKALVPDESLERTCPTCDAEPLTPCRAGSSALDEAALLRGEVGYTVNFLLRAHASRSEPSWLEEPCPKCGAATGAACRTEDGRRCEPHLARTPMPGGAMEVECPTCGAEPMKPCITRKGVATSPHAPRALLAEGQEPEVPAERSVKCPTCSAPPGERCVSSSGRVVQNTHWPRVVLAGDGAPVTFVHTYDAPATPCPTCGAAAGVACTMTDRKRPRAPHAARVRHVAGLSAPCPTCRAAAGQRCTSRSGRTVQNMHTPRITLEELL